MESYVLTFPAFVVAVAGLGWWFVQRQLKKADDDQEAKDADIKKQFESLVIWQQKQGDRLRDVELKLAEKISREELTEVRAEIKEDLQAFQASMISALAGLK